MNNRNYEDMLYLPHPVSKKHPQMSRLSRAAQFSAFRALTGHEDAIKETERLTDNRVEQDEYELEELNLKLLCALEYAGTEKRFRITYYVLDEKKEGGRYVTKVSCIKKYLAYDQKLILQDGTEVPVTSIYKIEEQEGQLV